MDLSVRNSSWTQTRSIFIINQYDRRTISHTGDTDIKYDYFVSGSDVMTLMLLLNGALDARIMTRCWGFQRKSAITRWAAFMKTHQASATERSLRHGWKRRRFLCWTRNDLSSRQFEARSRANGSPESSWGHNITESLSVQLQGIGIYLHYLPPNATEELQPTDSFEIQKVKNMSTKHWEDYKFRWSRMACGR